MIVIFLPGIALMVYEEIVAKFSMPNMCHALSPSRALRRLARARVSRDMSQIAVKDYGCYFRWSEVLSLLMLSQGSSLLHVSAAHPQVQYSVVHGHQKPKCNFLDTTTE